MPKDKLTDYDATAANNTDVGGISVDEGMLPSNVNNAIREVMSHLKDFAAGTEAVDAIEVTGDLTVDTDTLKVDSTNNRVGIGTSLPSKDLHIKTTTADNQIRVEASGGNLNVGNDNTGSYVESSGSRPLRTFVGGSERMRITAAGALIAGGTSPIIDQAGCMTLQREGGAFLNLVDTTSSNNGDEDALGTIRFGDTVNDSNTAQIQAFTDGSSPSAGLRFYTQSSTQSSYERMRISAKGVMSFRGNNAAPQSNSYGVFINATRSAGNTNGAVLGGIMVGYSGGNYGGIGYGLQPSSTSGRYVSSVNDYHSFMDFTAGGFKTYTTTSTRNANSQLDFNDELVAGPYINRGAGSWSSSSDERLKQNISEISQTTAYDHVKTARAVQYNWKYGSNTSQDYIGFIAQDWETNYPEVVTTEDDAVHGISDPKGVRYTETVPVLMAALKEAIAKIETLETKVATLETENADFETRIAVLESA